MFAIEDGSQIVISNELDRLVSAYSAFISAAVPNELREQIAGVLQGAPFAAMLLTTTECGWQVSFHLGDAATQMYEDARERAHEIFPH
jgi:hypothetical protein